MIDRRTLLEATLALLLAPAALARAKPPAATPPLDPALAKALAESPFVYVSPLRANGEESRCHGEVWFGWFDGAVVVITAVKTWKARSLARGLDRARIWVGDYGRFKKVLGTNEAFRQGPSFLARAELVRDRTLIDRLLGIYEKKYPDQIAGWRGPMRSGFEEGSRILIRYVPDART